jgi:hypothetical protein
MEDTTIDIGKFVNELVEEWDIDQLIEYVEDNLYDFYRTHEEALKNDYKLFLEDHEAHHVQGY